MAIIRLLLAALVSVGGGAFDVHAFANTATSSSFAYPRLDRPSWATRDAAAASGERHVLFASNNENDDNNNEEGSSDRGGSNNNNGNPDEERGTPLDNWMTSRLQRADFLEIRRDIILTTCFVLGRYFFYDVTTGQKLVPGFDVQDAIYLSGTLSSAAVLGAYWTAAGLLTRLFETRATSMSLLANSVNIAMCLPVWVATEHALHFGPPDVGGPTLDAAVASGFAALALFMAVMKTATLDWR